MFAGVQLATEMVWKPPITYLQGINVYSSVAPSLITLTRAITPILLSSDQEWQSHLVEMQLTDSWIKHLFNGLLVFLYVSFPIAWHGARSLLTRYPGKWGRLHRLYMYLDRFGRVTQTNRDLYARKHRIDSVIARKQLRTITFLFQASMWSWFNFLLIVVVIAMFSWIKAIHRDRSWSALTCQLVTFVHFKLAFNFVSENLGLIFMFFYTNLVYYRYRTQQLIRQLNKITLVGDSCLIDGSHMSRWLRRCALLADEVRFLQRLTAVTMGCVFFAACFCTVGYVFLIYFTDVLSINRTFIIFVNFAISVPFLSPPCVLGQLLTNQVHFYLRKIAN
jgi:hypothetical protein